MRHNREASCAQACQICKACDLTEVKNFSSLPRITSDCRNFGAGGKLFVCLTCGCVQKLPDAHWLEEIDGIYSNYEVYYQSGGEEQIVFDRVTGTLRQRSDVILERLAAEKQLGAKGRAIDVGCGNGATLRAMSRTLTGWSFSGYELKDGALPRLSRIPRFEKLYTGILGAIDERFDLVTMVHSLEHFPSPRDVLLQLLPVVGNGKIFINVSNIAENPFDILIADHLMHFSPEILSDLLRRAGFLTTLVATDWVPKEISLLAKKAENKKMKDSSENFLEAHKAEKVFVCMSAYVDWLRNTVDQVRTLVHEGRSLGIFGTSIAATWLAETLPAGVDFFVDEDSSRVGKEHRGKPILHPSQVPESARVYFALVPSLAETIADRLKANKFEKILPVPMEIRYPCLGFCS